MTIISWLCTNSSKNLFVKIVHPGGHVELHDHPILAAELLNRNPKCCVAHPTVFQQPCDVISPETTLTLGRKYYVVPLGTIRKLQNKYSPAHIREYQRAQIQQLDNDTDSSCWLVRKNRKKSKNGSQMVKSGISSSESSNDSEKKMVKTKKRATNDSAGEGNEGVPAARLSLTSMDYWQPGLASITEEYQSSNSLHIRL